MNHAVVLLHAFKDTCALHCLVALYLAGPLPVTQQVIMALTGFDDAAVRRGLNKLLVMGLVTCSGRRNQTGWQLTPAAQQLPLPIGPGAFRALGPASALDPLPGPAASDVLASPPAPAGQGAGTPGELAPSIPANAESDEPVIPAPSALEITVEIEDDSIDSDLLMPVPERRSPNRPLGESPAPRRARSPAAAARRSQFFAALRAGGVYPQCRAPLAQALLDDPEVDWLAHALGWICCAVRDCSTLPVGAVVYPKLRDRVPCEPEYLPPPDLPFEAALVWAQSGGLLAAEVGEAADPVSSGLESDGRMETSGDSAPGDGAGEGDARAAAVWPAVLERLRRELPRGCFDARLRHSALLSLAEGRAVVAVRDPGTRQWLANQLTGAVERVLAEVGAGAATVEFVVGEVG